MSEFRLQITEPLALKGTVNVEVPGPPHSYLAAGRCLAKGLGPLAAAGPDCNWALAFLAGQVSECAIKAYLSRGGDDERLKRPEIRHDLLELWALAQREGLRVTVAPPAWLDILARLHGNPHPLRYVSGNLILALPSREYLAAEVKAMLQACAAQL